MDAVDVLLFTKDLLGSSRVSGVVRGHGLQLRVVRTPDALTAAVAARLRAVLVDLELPLELAELDDALQASPAQRIAFGPHVDAQRLETARQAGWHVLTRGQFDAGLPQLVRSWAEDNDAKDGSEV